MKKLTLSLILILGAPSAAQLQVAEVAAGAPYQYHDKVVTFSGTVRKLRRGENAKSRPYILFELTEEGGKRFIAARSYELDPISEGQSVTVTGRFLEAPRDARTGSFPSRRLGSLEVGKTAPAPRRAFRAR